MNANTVTASNGPTMKYHCTVAWAEKTKGCKAMFTIIFSLLVKNFIVISSLLDIKIFSFI